MKRLSYALLWLFWAVCAVSCSVKEDRRNCPCLLELDFTPLVGELFDSLEVDVRYGGNVVCRDMLKSDSFSEIYSREVPRGELVLNVYCFIDGVGFELLTSNVAGIGIPRGNECPGVYMCSREIDARGELLREEVSLSKNFCRMSVEMVHDGPCPYILEVTGNICGYDRLGMPKSGEFNFVPQTDEHGRCSIDVPRQIDSSLQLVIGDEDGALKTFAVGEYIVAAGYDWNAEDLEDITIVIDYARTEARFEIGPWKDGGSFNVII